VRGDQSNRWFVCGNTKGAVQNGSAIAYLNNHQLGISKTRFSYENSATSHIVQKTSSKIPNTLNINKNFNHQFCGSIVIELSLQVRYSRNAGVPRFETGRVVLGNSNRRRCLDRPGDADKTYWALAVETVSRDYRTKRKARRSAATATVGGQIRSIIGRTLAARNFRQAAKTDPGQTSDLLKSAKTASFLKKQWTKSAFRRRAAALHGTGKNCEEIGYPATGICWAARRHGVQPGRRFGNRAKGGLAAASPVSRILVSPILGWKEYELEVRVWTIASW